MMETTLPLMDVILSVRLKQGGSAQLPTQTPAQKYVGQDSTMDQMHVMMEIHSHSMDVMLFAVWRPTTSVVQAVQVGKMTVMRNGTMD